MSNSLKEEDDLMNTVKQKRNKKVKIAIFGMILPMMLLFLTGCKVDDFNFLKFYDGSVGIPKVGTNIMLDIPEVPAFEFEMSQEMYDYLQSLEGMEIENIPDESEIRRLLGDIDSNLGNLSSLLNNIRMPQTPIVTFPPIVTLPPSEDTISISIDIGCGSLYSVDPDLFDQVSNDGEILSATLSVKKDSSINDVMLELQKYSGKSIPVLIDGTGTITSISGVTNGTHQNTTTGTYYECEWLCFDSNDSRVSNTQNYILQNNDFFLFYYQCT